MAFEGEINEQRHIPFYTDKLQHYEQRMSDYWTMDRVVRWLEVNDFKPAIEFFKAKNICGRTFLEIDMPLLMTFQNELMLSLSEKRKLAHAIKALRASEDHHYHYNNVNNIQRYPNNYNAMRINNGSRYPIMSANNSTDRLVPQQQAPSSDLVVPLIPERKSSNNEQVLDWMKSFNMPKRTIPTAVATVRASNASNGHKRFPSQTTIITPNNNNSNVNNPSRFSAGPSSPRTGENDGTWKFVRRRPNMNTSNSSPSSTTTSTLTSTSTTSLNSPYLDHPIQVTPPPPPPQMQPQQSIHVTKDSDTFHSLQVTGMHDPRLIKNTILRKLGLEGKCEQYLFFHENGKNSDIALTDSELSHLCQSSDHTSTNRILVKPADHAFEKKHYRSYSKDGMNCYDFAVQGAYPRRYLGQYALNNTNNCDLNVNRSRYDNGLASPVNGTNQFTNVVSSQAGVMEDDSNNTIPKSGKNSRKQSIDTSTAATPSPPRPSSAIAADNNKNSSLWAISPVSQKSNSSFMEPQKHNSQPSQQLWPVHQDVPASFYQKPATSTTITTTSKQPSLWAVPPKQSHEETVTPVPPPSLRAVPPSSNRSRSNTNDSIDMKTQAISASIVSTSPVSLWAVAPSTTSTSTSEPASSSSPLPSLWAVPPSTTTNAATTTPTPTPSPSLWAVPPSTTANTATTTPTPSPSLWAVPPSTTANTTTSTPTPSPSLWAVPPSTTANTTTSTPTPTPSPSPSLWAVPPSTTANTATTMSMSSSSLWAVAPQKLQQKEEQQEQQEHQPISNELATKDSSENSLDSPIPQFSSENLNLHPSVSAKTYNSPTPKQSRGVQFTTLPSESEEDFPEPHSATSVKSTSILEDSIGSVTLTDPSDVSRRQHRSLDHQQLHIDTSSSLLKADHNEFSPLSSSSPSGLETEEENWAERPSVERLYKDIDKYLPGHDLDKEIIVEQPAVQTASLNSSSTTSSNGGAVLVSALPPGRRLVGHKKSIRNVAREAHRNWRNAVNVIYASNNLVRRHSTKMWHRNVEQVKPGMKPNITNDTNKPKSKKLQWIRGELIGKGSFGRVYHALNVEAGEWIAVKQVDLPTTKSDYNNPQLRETKDALFREISLLEDLDNEYIVQYLGYNVDEEEGYINIFLEYVPGGSIASCLSKTGKFEVPLVRFFTKQILMGLAYLHSRNVLHRDIKAGNILLDQNGVCKITDFGLSKLSGQDKAYDPHSNNSVMRGTVYWMAPEVVKGTNYNAKVDIWSLGCTVIEMLTSKHPWLDLNMLAALYSLGKYQAPPIPDDIPDDARDFLNQCFIINPEERPTAEQLLKHPFVQPDPNFEFKKYMKKVEIERKASKRLNAVKK
ncbi:uncharacterized protein BX663DRAFT_540592 [Cokeromyces recurvatus]|uniref:uncharacterized protein n=1 Tax=Cokeromyces recurvatus TaxID=90255 RepID=UPI002220EEDF|nr:uncharacterized protein BX663DRAFT_540592 [Cokeromyces recurvatus]KAI7905920.1 hypothetical protein BX663DRAFT_540592 [Cokeromyces recurvatus]